METYLMLVNTVHLRDTVMKTLSCFFFYSPQNICTKDMSQIQQKQQPDQPSSVLPADLEQL